MELRASYWVDSLGFAKLVMVAYIGDFTSASVGLDSNYSMVEVGDMMWFGLMNENAPPEIAGLIPIWLIPVPDCFYDLTVGCGSSGMSRSLTDSTGLPSVDSCSTLGAL